MVVDVVVATEVGVISLGGMVYAGSVRVGGDISLTTRHHQCQPELRHDDW